MYELYFNLQRRPFSAIPDSHCIHRHHSLQTSLDELVVCLERGEGIAVLTAAPGLGKSLLCQRVQEELGEGFLTIVIRHANFDTPLALLQTLLTELKIPVSGLSEQELRLQWHEALNTLRSKKQVLVLVCDEAHLLDERVLEELRIMTDLADHGVSRVRLLLAGQLELEEKLTAPGLSALSQRLRASSSLSALTTSESVDYIDYRITWAGGRTEELFSPEALLAIADAADGVPRCLNQLCDHVLLLAYVAESKPAGPELVTEALNDLKHLPLNWNIRSRRDREEIDVSAAGSQHAPHAEMPQFGEHLAAWESSPNLESSDSETASSGSSVWEFGLDEEESDSTETLRRMSNFAEMGRESASRSSSDFFSGDDSVDAHEEEAGEEPVVDRYAAIDGGWWNEQRLSTPIEERTPTPKQMSETNRSADGGFSSPGWTDWKIHSSGAPAEYEPPVSARIVPLAPAEVTPVSTVLEERLKSEVLDLVATARNAVNSSSSEPAPFSTGATASFESEVVSSDEFEPSDRSEARPYRNLFTRLRRKQKGLE